MKETPFPIMNLTTIFNRNKKTPNPKTGKKAFKDKFCPLAIRPDGVLMEFYAEKHLDMNCIRTFLSGCSKYQSLSKRWCSYCLSCIQTLPFTWRKACNSYLSNCNPITAPGQNCSFSEIHLGICIHFRIKIRESILSRYRTILLLACLVC